MGLKRRRAFNKQWRQDRKVLKAAYRPGAVFDPEVIVRLAAKYNINFPKERVK